MTERGVLLDPEVLFGWLREVGEALDSALAASEVHASQLDHLIGLLFSVGVSPNELVAVLPDRVVASRRKILGIGPLPGWLRTGDEGSASGDTKGKRSRPGRTASVPGSQSVNGSRLNPAQERVLQFVVHRTRSAGVSVDLTTEDISFGLQQEGERTSMVDVRYVVGRLKYLGILDRPRRGHYVLSSAASGKWMDVDTEPASEGPER
jgi:hypothetical protein